jgi:hypothetical protein
MKIFEIIVLTLCISIPLFGFALFCAWYDLTEDRQCASFGYTAAECLCLNDTTSSAKTACYEITKEYELKMKNNF